MGARLSPEEDAQRYRDGYPGQKETEDPKARYNQEFYANKRRSTPDGDTIENILDCEGNWWANYELLEEHHGYIQWLFPIREEGMNDESQPLTAYEAEEMRGDPVTRQRLLRSYRLILNFYGMVLESEETGVVSRNESNWSRQYENLQYSRHNYLRITRIIKCLGELGFAHFQAPWCELFIKEVFETRELSNCAQSLVEYWIPVVKDDQARQRLEDIAMSRLRAARGGVAEEDEDGEEEGGGGPASSAMDESER